MTHAHAHPRIESLAIRAEMAGLALACHFSSSQEYEAAVIQERRQAGAWRLPLWRQWALRTLAGIGALRVL